MRLMWLLSEPQQHYIPIWEYVKGQNRARKAHRLVDQSCAQCSTTADPGCIYAWLGNVLRDNRTHVQDVGGNRAQCGNQRVLINILYLQHNLPLPVGVGREFARA